jgi:replicative DNA helicase
MVMRSPPQSVEAERALLGLAIVDGAGIVRACEGVFTAEDMFSSAHQAVWRSICAVAARGDAVDMLTVRVELERRGELPHVGGDEYLLGLTDTLASSDAETLGRMIRDDSQRRAIIAICQDQAAAGYRRDTSTTEYVEQTSARIFAAIRDDAATRGGLVDAQDSLVTYWQRATKIREAKGLLGVLTGIQAVDASIGGLWDGDLAIVAGRPSMGKTAMLETLAMNACHVLAANEKILFFSAEMSSAVLWPRLLAKLATIGSRYIRDYSGETQSHTGRDIANALDYARRLPLMIDDTSGISIGQIRNRARRAASSTRVRMVCVDYLQLVKPSAKHERNDLAIAEVAVSLKELARELDCPVVAAAQINRGSVNRTDKRPMISDIRDSGMIEQAADMILMLHREGYYAPPTPPPDHGATEIIVGKNRNGETSTIRARFLPERCMFVDDAGTQQYRGG